MTALFPITYQKLNEDWDVPRARSEDDVALHPETSGWRTVGEVGGTVLEVGVEDRRELPGPRGWERSADRGALPRGSARGTTTFTPSGHMPSARSSRVPSVEPSSTTTSSRLATGSSAPSASSIAPSIVERSLNTGIRIDSPPAIVLSSTDRLDVLQRVVLASDICSAMNPVSVRSGIVVDLGCFPHRDEISLVLLLERFRPAVLYGFDPWPALVEGETEVDGTTVLLERKAAWIADGEIEFARVRGLRGWDSTVMREKNARDEWSRADAIRVSAFDFSAWLRELPEPPVVKLDVEGAEFPILQRLVHDGTDELVAELLVEWHDDKMPEYAERRAELEASLRCRASRWEDAKTTVLSTVLGLWKSRRALGVR